MTGSRGRPTGPADERIVGAIVRHDLSNYVITADDARMLVRQKVATPVQAIIESTSKSTSKSASNPAAPDLDSEAASILARAAKRAALASMRQAATANRVQELLAEAGIRAIVYKGVAASAMRDGAWAGRESVDVDVLIDPSDVATAHQVLSAHGLARVDGVERAPGPIFRYHDIELAYRGLPSTVDLHWRLESPGYLEIPFGDLWERRVRVDSNGLDVWTLDPLDATLLTAVHGTREEWRTLRQMLDITAALDGLPREQWLRLTDLSRYGASKSLAVALAVAESCGADVLPAAPGDWARSTARAFMENWSYRASGAAGSRNTRTPRAALRRRVLKWRLAPTPSAAMNGLARSAARQVLHKRSWVLRQPRS